MMNVSRYTPSGSTQRKGIAAMSRQSLLVVATSSTEATPGSTTQRKRSRAVGFFSCRVGAGADLTGEVGASAGPAGRETFRSRHAHAPQSTAKTPRPADQPRPMAPREKRGSKKNG